MHGDTLKGKARGFHRSLPEQHRAGLLAVIAELEGSLDERAAGLTADIAADLAAEEETGATLRRRVQELEEIEGGLNEQLRATTEALETARHQNRDLEGFVRVCRRAFGGGLPHPNDCDPGDMP